MTLILSKTEIDRMKASLLPSVENKSTLDRKAELKKKSEEKLKHWPNTLEAIRIKKEHAILDRERLAELQRQEVDKQVRFSSVSHSSINAQNSSRRRSCVGPCDLKPFRRLMK
jgi:hypothetical protein